MRKILLGLLVAILFFVLLVGGFILLFVFTEVGDEVAVESDSTAAEIDLQEVAVVGDSVQTALDSLMALVAVQNATIDSLDKVLKYQNAAQSSFEERLQTQAAEIVNLRRVDVNAQAMARTFATMSVPELVPIVAQLSDKVVLDIYKNTSNKRRKFLLAAMGNDRAAELTNKLVHK